MRIDIGSAAWRAYRIVGRVQGVGFRWWTRRTAERLSLYGSVRNLTDGSVEVHVTGGIVDLLKDSDAEVRTVAAANLGQIVANYTK